VKRHRIVWIACWLFVALLSPTSNGQIDSNYDYFLAKQKRFNSFEKDFVSFAKAHMGDSLEYQIAEGFQVVAALSQERMNAARMLTDINDNLVCPADRELVRVHLRRLLDSDISLISLDIESMNNGLSYTRFPAISQTAIQMKDELREVKSRLETVRKSLD